MPERTVRPRRSFIFTPGPKPEMYPKALACGADIVCVELEDGIAPKDKAAARAGAVALFTEPPTDDGVERIVRINCVREAFGLADVQAVLVSDTPDAAQIERARRIIRTFEEADTAWWSSTAN